MEQMGIKEPTNELMFTEDRDNNNIVIVSLWEAYAYAITWHTQVRICSVLYHYVVEVGDLKGGGKASLSRPAAFCVSLALWEFIPRLAMMSIRVEKF